MTSIVIFKAEDGKLRGLGEEHERAYARWKRLVANMDIGETLEFSFTIPQSPKHHRAFFRKVRILLERTEAMTDFEGLRKWLTAGAGYVNEDGTVQSLSYASMDEVQFSQFHRKVDDFLRSDHATSFLWPHLTDKARGDAIESFFFAVEQRQEQQL